MLIFLVCLNVLILGIFLIIYDKKEEEELYFTGVMISGFTGIVLFSLIMALILNGASSREKATQLSIDYANLEYYITHQEKYNERTLVESINKYNAELKSFRAKQQSPWLNWFYPGDVSECGYIIWEDKSG